MPLRTLRRLAGLALLLISLGVLAWGSWPRPVETRRLALQPGELGAGAPSAYELELRWQPRLRAGERAGLALRLLPQDNPPPGAPPQPAATAGAAVVALEARLELPGIAYTPRGRVTQFLLPGRMAEFDYTLLPDAPGAYPATLWLHRLPSAGSAESTAPRVITAQQLQFDVQRLAGLDGRWARALGATGALLALPVGLDGAAAWLWRRLAARYRPS
ncbi:MAG: hypothetical protein ACKOC5_16275 [Chloroflexota bacterium]